MSLREVKKILNIDQQNIIVCEVVKDFDTYTNVRTPKGKTVRAGKSVGISFTTSSKVEVRTDGRTYTVIGGSTYAEYAADRNYVL